MAVNNALHGYEKDDVNIKEAVYRVKNNDNTDKYSRIHFETNSKMIYDATHLATGNKVARRNADGDIWFKNITASGKVTTGSIENNGASILKGTTTIGANVAANGNALVVSVGNTSLAGKLAVTGTSTFTGLTTHTNGATLSKKLTVTSGGAEISGATSISGGLTSSSLVVNANTTLGGSTSQNTLNGTTTISKLVITNSGVVTNLNSDRVDGCHVNDSAAAATNILWTSKKISDSYPTKTEMAQAIANANVTVSEEFLSQNPTNRADNGNQLIMQNFTMKYNSTNKSIDFIFV